ncbi:MAG: hypothetical protein L3J56_13675 [Bacteroidales bacterium]|nr:hypothetical protein [Bacteroidales bacterium]
MKKEIKQFGKLSEEEVEKLKKEHGIIYTLDVYFEDENGEIVQLFAYLKKPERHVVSMALSFKDSDPLRAKEIMLEKSWLAGDERIKTNDDAFYTASSVLDGLLVVRFANLKKN